MKDEVRKAMEIAQEARGLFRFGKISEAEAKRRIQPYLDMVNEGGKRMAKEYGNTFRKVTITGFLR